LGALFNISGDVVDGSNSERFESVSVRLEHLVGPRLGEKLNGADMIVYCHDQQVAKADLDDMGGQLDGKQLGQAALHCPGVPQAKLNHDAEHQALLWGTCSLAGAGSPRARTSFPR
jgi:hypothetical protein